MSQGSEGRAPERHDTTSSIWNRSPQLWWVKVTERPHRAWHNLFYLESFPPAVMSQDDGKAPQGMTQPLLFGIVPPAVMSQGDGKAPQGMTQPLPLGIVSPAVMSQGDGKAPQGMTRPLPLGIVPPAAMSQGEWRKGPRKAWHALFYLESSHQLWWVGVKERPQKGLTWPLLFGIVPPAVMSRGEGKAPERPDMTSSIWNRPTSCDESGGVKERPQKGLTWPLLFGIVPPAVMSRGEGKAPERPDMTSSIWNRPTSCDESGWRKGPRKAWHDLFYLESSHQLWWVRGSEGKAPERPDTTSFIWNRPPPPPRPQAMMSQGEWRKAPERPHMTSAIWNHPTSCDELGWRKGPSRAWHDTTSSAWNHPTSCDESGWRKGPSMHAGHDMTWPLPLGIVPPAVMSQGDRRAPACMQGMTWHDLFRLESSHQLWWVRVTEGPQQGMTRHDLFCLESSHQLWWVSEGRAPERPDMTSSIWNCPPSCDELGVKEWPQQGMTQPLPLGIVPPAVPLWWVGVEGRASEVCARPLFLCFGCFLLGLAACCRGLPTSSWSSGLLDCLGWNDTQAHFVLIVSARKSTGGSRFKNLPNPKMPNTIPGKQGEGGCIFIYIYIIWKKMFTEWKWEWISSIPGQLPGMLGTVSSEPEDAQYYSR